MTEILLKIKLITYKIFNIFMFLFETCIILLRAFIIYDICFFFILFFLILLSSLIYPKPFLTLVDSFLLLLESFFNNYTILAIVTFIFIIFFIPTKTLKKYFISIINNMFRAK